MRRSMVLAFVASLWLLTSGCRSLPQSFPCYNSCDSFKNCVSCAVRKPADWCWGNCPVEEVAEVEEVEEAAETEDAEEAEAAEE